MPKAKKSTGTQILLTFVMTVVLLSGFGLVFAVDYYYTNLNGTTDEIELFTTDSNTEYPVTDYIPTFVGNRYFDSQTGQRMGKGSDWIQFNRTPAYLGNDTWSASINNTVAMEPYGWQYFSIQNSLFDVDTWVLTKITVNLTLNADTDLRVATSLDCLNTFSDPADTTQGNILFHDTTVSGVTYYNKTYTIPLSVALTIFDTAQERTDYLLFCNIYDKDADGLTAWACQWKITLHGRIVSGWNEQTSVSVALLGAISMNVIVGIYALDQFDIGGAVRDLPRRKPKRRSK